MTVTNLWNACSNWTPFSKVRIYSVTGSFRSEYSYFEDALRDWPNDVVLSFIYDTSTDTMDISVK